MKSILKQSALKHAGQPLLLLLLLSPTIRADFTLTLSVTGHSTSGNCFGDDLTGACETFLSIFCLRGPRQTSSIDTSDCPLGVNQQQLGPDQNSGMRTISSSQPWPGGFQMFIQAFDDDSGASSPDHLDNIIANANLAVDTGFSPVRTVSGSRVTINMQFRVDCATNFFGSDCSVFCVPQDDDVNGHFTCDPTDGSRVCLSDFYGPECLTFCLAANDETNGFFTCDPSDGSRICREGYTNPEDFCRENIDDCASAPCQNGGICMDLVSNFMCNCVPGFTDPTCSTDIDECLTANCPTNSTCVEDEVNSFVCECHAGFEGENCTEIRPCDSVTCENGGTCVSDDPFSFQCVCAAGYNGSTCQQDIDECLEAVCPEDSTCVDQVSGFTCALLRSPTLPTEFPSQPLPGAAAGFPKRLRLIIGCSVAGGGLLILLLLVAILIVCIAIARRRRKGKELGAGRKISNVYYPEPTLGKPNDHLEENVMYSNPDSLSVSTFAPRVAMNTLYGDSTPGNIPIIYEQIKGEKSGQDVNSNAESEELVDNPLYSTSADSDEPKVPIPNGSAVTRSSLEVVPVIPSPEHQGQYESITDPLLKHRPQSLGGLGGEEEASTFKPHYATPVPASQQTRKVSEEVVKDTPMYDTLPPANTFNRMSESEDMDSNLMTRYNKLQHTPAVAVAAATDQDNIYEMIKK